MVKSPDNKVPFRGELYSEDQTEFNKIRRSKDLKVAQLFHEMLIAYKDKYNINIK
jgi:hypothetical protein